MRPGSRKLGCGGSCGCGGRCGSRPMQGILSDIGSILAPRDSAGNVQPMATIVSEVYVPMPELLKLGAFTIGLAYIIKKVK